MSAPKRWSIQQIFTATYKDVANTEVYAVLDDLKTCSLENNQEVVFSSGGVGNAYISAFSHSKRTTGTASAATYQNEVMALITGTDVATGATTVPVNKEVAVVTSNGSETEFTAVGTAGSELIGVYELNLDGSLGTEYTQVVGVPSTGECQYTSGTKAVTFFAGDIADGTQIALFYEAATDATSHTISNDTEEFSKIVRIELETLVQDACNGLDYAATIIIYRAKLTGSFSFDLSSDGDAGSLDVSFEALKGGCTNSHLWDMIVAGELV